MLTAKARTSSKTVAKRGAKTPGEVKITTIRQVKLRAIAAKVGKTPASIANAAIDLYLEELQDYLDVQAIKKKGEKSISLEQLGKELGLEG